MALPLNRHQAIIWTNDGLDYGHKHVSLDLKLIIAFEKKTSVNIMKFT